MAYAGLLMYSKKVRIDIGIETELDPPNGGLALLRSHLSARPIPRRLQQSLNEVGYFSTISLGTILVIVLLIVLLR